MFPMESSSSTTWPAIPWRVRNLAGTEKGRVTELERPAGFLVVGPKVAPPDFPRTRRPGACKMVR